MQSPSRMMTCMCRNKWNQVSKPSCQRLILKHLVMSGVVECLVSYLAVEAANMRAALHATAETAEDVINAVMDQTK